MTLTLDSIDLQILSELQRDGRMTNVALASRVGISAPPCLRRLRRLEQAGLIRGYRARLDGKALGFDVACFAMVQLRATGKAEVDSFAERVRGWKPVRECWTLSGEIDVMLRCVFPNLESFQAFVAELMGHPNVRAVRTALVLGQIKDEPLVPL
jgi:DNA-binding Lrp family transcriptional regulator